MSTWVEESARNFLFVGVGVAVGATAAAIAAPVAGPDWVAATSAGTPGAALVGACLAQRRHRSTRLDPTRARLARILVGAALTTAAVTAFRGDPAATTWGLWAMTVATVAVSVLAASVEGSVRHADFPPTESESHQTRLTA